MLLQNIVVQHALLTLRIPKIPTLIFLSKYLEYKSSDMAIVCDFQLHRSSNNLVSSSGEWSILLLRNVICFIPAEGIAAVLFHQNFSSTFIFHFQLMLLRVFKFSRSLTMIFFSPQESKDYLPSLGLEISLFGVDECLSAVLLKMMILSVLNGI